MFSGCRFQHCWLLRRPERFRVPAYSLSPNSFYILWESAVDVKKDSQDGKHHLKSLAVSSDADPPGYAAVKDRTDALHYRAAQDRYSCAAPAATPF
jgi:hypothetical protein